jgi:hypothetical protein
MLHENKIEALKTSDEEWVLFCIRDRLEEIGQAFLAWVTKWM